MKKDKVEKWENASKDHSREETGHSVGSKRGSRRKRWLMRSDEVTIQEGTNTETKLVKAD